MSDQSLTDLRAQLDAVDYLVDEGLSMALFLAIRLGQPLLLQAYPGFGQTTAAKALAAALGTPLNRLKSNECKTAAEALYEWNNPRQMLYIRHA